MRRTHWRALPSRRDEARAWQQRHQLHPVVAHILLNRGIDEAAVADFLGASPALCGDPATLKDVDRAAERLAQAVRRGEKVVIHGDYDADGTCGGALLTRFLRARDVPLAYYVPDRFDEGYGVHAPAVLEIIRKHKPKLMVTVDCGISSAAEIETAVALGTEVIVTDHHQVPERIPSVPAVNPHRADCDYPFKELSGTAVAYQLCRVTAGLLGEDPAALESDLLELVMIGTVADVMPLVGENRYYTRRGLELLAQTSSPGLHALLQTARLGEKRLTARDVAFSVGPRLNAAGRLESADLAYRLLVTEDNAEAWELAERLEALNRERREIEERLLEEATAQVEEFDLAEHWGLVVAGDGWHEGVLGLIAGRLCRQHHRPVLAISLNGESAKGSGRSTPAVNLHAVLTECAPLLQRFGGHPRAAGFSLAKDQVPALRERFNAVIKEQITEDALVKVIDLECPVKASALTLELAHEIARLAPFGEGNPEPLLEIRGLRLREARATRDGLHAQLLFRIEDPRGGRELKGFWPRMGWYAERLPAGAEVAVAASLGIDTWQGREAPQLLVEDLRASAD